MDLLGRQGGRGEGTHPVRVGRGAVGGVPEADGLAAGGQVFGLDEVGQPGISRQDFAGDGRADAFAHRPAGRLAPVGGDAADDPPERALLDGRGGQATQLRHEADDAGARRHPALGHPLAHQGDRAVDEAREGRQPAQVILQVAHGRGRVERGVLGQIERRAAQMVQRDEVAAEGLSAELGLQLEGQQFPLDPPLRVQPGRVDRAEGRQRRPAAGDPPVVPGEGGVGQAVVVAVIAAKGRVEGVVAGLGLAVGRDDRLELGAGPLGPLGQQARLGLQGRPDHRQGQPHREEELLPHRRSSVRTTPRSTQRSSTTRVVPASKATSGPKRSL